MDRLCQAAAAVAKVATCGETVLPLGELQVPRTWEKGLCTATEATKPLERCWWEVQNDTLALENSSGSFI